MSVIIGWTRLIFPQQVSKRKVQFQPFMKLWGTDLTKSAPLAICRNVRISNNEQGIMNVERLVFGNMRITNNEQGIMNVERISNIRS